MGRRRGAVFAGRARRDRTTSAAAAARARAFRQRGHQEQHPTRHGRPLPRQEHKGGVGRRGTDLQPYQGFSDLWGGLPAFLAARDEVGRLVHRQAQLPSVELYEPRERHALDGECLLGQVGHDARQICS